MGKRNTAAKGFSSPSNRKLPSKIRCPKCKREVDSLRCGHCGSSLPAEQADLFGAVVTKIAKLGGNRTDVTKKGGGTNDTSNPDYLAPWKRATPKQRRNPKRAVKDNGIDLKQVAQEFGDLQPKDFQALLTFVETVGGWTRAKWVLEEGHKKWQQSQNG